MSEVGETFPTELERYLTKTCFSPFDSFSPLTSAYLAAVNAACERAPMIYPRAVSDGQFYSPPESVAGDVLFSPQICSCLISVCVPEWVVFLLLPSEPQIDFWL